MSGSSYTTGPIPESMDFQRFHLNAGAAEFVPQQEQHPANGQRHDVTKLFRFLDLPREIRIQVYEELLCPYPEHNLDPDGDDPGPDIAPLYETAVLYANRQTYYEAREAMLKGNRFVRVFTRGVSVIAILAKLPVHVVVHSHYSRKNRVVQSFKGAVMSYFLRDEQDIREHGNAPCKTCDILILGRDLDAFVRGVGDPVVGGSKLAMAVKHHIKIHDPFKTSGNPIYSNLGAQKRLLQPFRDHFHGFPNVKISGNVDKALTADVLCEVQHETMPDSDEFISSIRKIKDEGNAFFRDAKFVKAIDRWRGASAKIQRLRSSRLWPTVKTQLGPDFVDTLAELFFNIHSDQTQVALAEMRDFNLNESDLEEEERIICALECVYLSFHMANTAPETFGSAWQPSVRQQAKLCFRSAQAARLGREYTHAQDFIERALDLQPNDVEIQREASAIEQTVFEIMADLGIFQAPGI